MPEIPKACPACGCPEDIRFRPKRDDWFCDACDHRWSLEVPRPATPKSSAVSSAVTVAAGAAATGVINAVVAVEPVPEPVVEPAAPAEHLHNLPLAEPFTGREWLFSLVSAWRNSDDDCYAVLNGPAGIGKTAFLAELANQVPRVLLSHRCVAGDRRGWSAWRFLTRLTAALESFPRFRNKCAGADAVHRFHSHPLDFLEEDVAAEMANVPDDGGMPWLVLIDGVDEASAADDRLTLIDLLEIAAPVWPRWIKFLFTATDWQPNGRCRSASVISLDAKADQHREDVHSYIRQRLNTAPLSEHFLASQREEREIIAALTDGDQTFQGVARTLDAVARDEYRLYDLSSLPKSDDALFRQFFAAEFNDAEHTILRRGLQVLLAAAEPISSNQLAAATGSKEADLENVLSRLRSVAGVVCEEDRWCLDSNALRSWLASPDAAEFRVDAAAGTLRLAKVLQQEYRANPERLSPLVVSQLPRMLRVAEDWDGLHEVLCDLRFVRQKAAAGELPELVRDYHLALEAMPGTEPAMNPDDKLQLQRYADALILAANEESSARPIPETPGSSLTPAVEDMGMAETRVRGMPEESSQASSAVGEVRDFARFVRRHATEITEAPNQIAQIAYNSAATGSVAESAGRLLSMQDEAWISREPRPRENLSECVAVMPRHIDDVQALAATPTFSTAVSAGNDRTMRVWNPLAGRQLAVLRGHTDDINAVAISADGRVAVSAGSDCSLRVWDLNSGEATKVIEEYEEGVTSIAMTPDARFAVTTGDWADTIRVWDLGEGKQVHELRGHEGSVTSVAMLPGGDRIVSAGFDKTVRVWDVKTGEQLAVMEGHNDGVIAVAVTPDGTRAVSSSFDQTVRVWDLVKHAELHSLEGHKGNVTSVGITPDGRYVVSGSSDQTVRVWDVHDGSCQKILRGHTAWVGAVVISPDARFALSAGGDHTLRLWDLHAASTAKRQPKHGGPVRSVASAHGIVVSASHDESASIWDTKRHKVHRVLKGHSGAVTSAAISPDRESVVTAGADGTVRVWNVETGRQHAAIRVGNLSINAIALHSKGRKFLCGCENGLLGDWDVVTGRSHQTWNPIESSINDLALVPESDCVAVATADGLWVFDLKAGKILHRIEAHRGETISVAVTADGKTAYTGGEDGAIRSWNLGNGYPLGEKARHNGPVYAVALSDDESFLTTGGKDEQVGVWQRSTGARVAVYNAGAPVFAVTGVSDSRFVCGCADGNLHFLTLHQP